MTAALLRALQAQNGLDYAYGVAGSGFRMASCRPVCGLPNIGDANLFDKRHGWAGVTDKHLAVTRTTRQGD